MLLRDTTAVVVIIVATTQNWFLFCLLLADEAGKEGFDDRITQLICR
jgi:hypothetical protein